MTTGSAPSWLRLTVSPPLPELLTSTSSARPARKAVRAEEEVAQGGVGVLAVQERGDLVQQRGSPCSRARV